MLRKCVKCEKCLPNCDVADRPVLCWDCANSRAASLARDIAGIEWWNKHARQDRLTMLGSPAVRDRGGDWGTEPESAARCYQVFGPRMAAPGISLAVSGDRLPAPGCGGGA